MSHRTTKNIPVWLLTTIFIFLSVIFWFVLFPRASASSAELVVGKRTVTLEVANTTSARTRGLSGRASLATDTGMLFIFPKSGVYSFWMNEMRFPLDIVWISQGNVVDLVTLPAPNGDLSAIPTYTPHSPADMVLEVNAGQAKSLGLLPGNPVNIQR